MVGGGEGNIKWDIKQLEDIACLLGWVLLAEKQIAVLQRASKRGMPWREEENKRQQRRHYLPSYVEILRNFIHNSTILDSSHFTTRLTVFHHLKNKQGLEEVFTMLIILCHYLTKWLGCQGHFKLILAWVRVLLTSRCSIFFCSIAVLGMKEVQFFVCPAFCSQEAANVKEPSVRCWRLAVSQSLNRSVIWARIWYLLTFICMKPTTHFDTQFTNLHNNS